MSDMRLSMRAFRRRCPDRPAASMEREGGCGLIPFVAQESVNGMRPGVLAAYLLEDEVSTLVASRVCIVRALEAGDREMPEAGLHRVSRDN